MSGAFRDLRKVSVGSNVCKKQVPSTFLLGKMIVLVMVVTARRMFQTPAPLLLCSLVTEAQASTLLMMLG